MLHNRIIKKVLKIFIFITTHIILLLELNWKHFSILTKNNPILLPIDYPVKQVLYLIRNEKRPERSFAMLTQEDLQAIAGLINTAVTASEERMIGRIAKSEERMIGRIAESEERTTGRIMSYIESHVEKELHQIADGHKSLSERVERIENKVDHISNRLDEIEGELVAQEYVITRMKKAQ